MCIRDSYTGALYAGGGGARSAVNGNATLTVKKAVFRAGSTLDVYKRQRVLSRSQVVQGILTQAG